MRGLKAKSVIEWIPPVAVILLGPLFIFPREDKNWIMLTALLLLWGASWIFGKSIFMETPLNVSVALLSLMAFIGVFVIRDIGGAAGKLAGLVYGIVVFDVLLKTLNSSRRLKIVVVVFLAAGVGLAVIGTLDRNALSGANISQIESQLPKIPHAKLAMKGAEAGVNPNPLGGMLLLFIPLAVMQWPLLMKKRFEYASPLIRRAGVFGLVVLSLILGISVVFTSSFGTWLALALGLWLMGDKKRSEKIIISGLLLFFVVIGFMNISRNLKEDDASLAGTINSSIRSRVEMWKVGPEAVKESPITGIGMDQLRRRPDFLYENSHAHNQFLHTAAELGIPGAIAYAALLIGVFWMAREIRLSNLPEWMKLTSRGLGTGIFAFTVFGLGDAIPLGAKPAVFFWVSLAMITSIYLYGRDHDLLKKDA